MEYGTILEIINEVKAKEAISFNEFDLLFKILHVNILSFKLGSYNNKEELLFLGKLLLAKKVLVEQESEKRIVKKRKLRILKTMREFAKLRDESKLAR